MDDSDSDSDVNTQTKMNMKPQQDIRPTTSKPGSRFKSDTAEASHSMAKTRIYSDSDDDGKSDSFFSKYVFDLPLKKSTTSSASNIKPPSTSTITKTTTDTNNKPQSTGRIQHATVLTKQ
jgi:hypothetical protein